MAKKTQREPFKRGRGRPPKPAAERKRGVLTMRVRDSLKEALAARASANQRSISEEVEYLLELVMQAQGSLFNEVLDLVFDRYAVSVALALAHVAHMVGGNSGAEEWLSNPYAFAQVREGVMQVLEAMRPYGDIVEPSAPTGRFASFSLIRTPEQRANLGRGLATGTLREVATPHHSRRQSKWAQLVADRLPATTLDRIRDSLSVIDSERGGAISQRKRSSDG